MRKFVLNLAYERYAAGYDPAYRKVQQPKYAALLGERGELYAEWAGIGGRALDLGCGSGLLAEWLDARGVPREHLVGLDLSKEMLQLATARGMSAVLGDVERLPFPSASFRLVTSFSALRLLFQRSRIAVQEAARVLEPGGRFVVSVLKVNWASGFEIELRHAGFDPGPRVDCGQDFGYACVLGS